MKVNWEKQEGNQGILTVEVEEEKVQQALDTAFKKVRTQVNVPGFRKGKVPRQLFEARFGVEALYQDAVDILLPESYSKAVEESGIEPVDRPEVDVEQIEKNKPFVFKATVTVKPDVELGEYKDLEIEPKDFSFKEEDVDEELATMRDRYAELTVVDGEAEQGDHVVIDFEGFVDGEPFEGGKAENHDLELGSGALIPGFEDQLIGTKAEEEKEVNVTFPEDYQEESLAGKDATFRVKVNEVKRKILSDLDDEFAKDVSEFDTLEELKEDIRKKVKERKEQEEEQYKKDAVIEKVTENATVDIPEAMIDQEADGMLQNFAQQLGMQGMNLDLYKQMSGMDEDEMREQFKDDAAKRVKSNLVLEAIAKAEEVEVTEEDLDKELERLAEMHGQEIEDVRKAFTGEGSLDFLRDEIRIQKTIERLVLNSQYAA